MKYISYCIILIISSIIIGCNSTKNNSNLKSKKDTNSKKVDTISIKNDSIGYEVIILEIGFNVWLQTQRPRGFYSLQFLEQRNMQYVAVYNNRFLEPSTYSRDLYPFYIDYDPNINYGYEVNYLLYHYFLFFEEKYGVKLRY